MQLTAAEKKRIDSIRQENKKKIISDPYIGFKDFEEAFSAARLTSQPEVFARLLNRENLFISGLAGAGKTTVLNRFINFIDACYEGQFNIAVTASTGTAASLIGGKTIHSWGGLGISTEPFDRKKIDRTMWSKRKAMRETDVLIIDEISMLPAHLFVKLDEILRFMRGNDEPFGGIQLVVTGDFLQLPPVSKKGDEHIDTRFAIETDTWKEVGFNYCFLDKTYRATDERLKKVLLEISSNNVTQETRDLLASRMGDVAKDPNKVYTQLFTKNRNVDKFNEDRLAENTNTPREFKYGSAGAKDKVELLMKQNNIPQKITLKVGATVMSTRNITDPTTGQLAASNGSIGEVLSMSFQSARVRFNNGKTLTINPHVYQYTEEVASVNPLTGKEVKYPVVKAEVKQIPLKLGYAITVHKSQGQTFDGVIVDLKDAFQEGLGYVALSRVRTLDDLVLIGMSEMAYKVFNKSKRISLYTKKSSFRERTKFIEQVEYYDDLLNNNIAQEIMWNTVNSAAAQNKENNGKGPIRTIGR